MILFCKSHPRSQDFFVKLLNCPYQSSSPPLQKKPQHVPFGGSPRMWARNTLDWKNLFSCIIFWKGSNGRNCSLMRRLSLTPCLCLQRVFQFSFFFTKLKVGLTSQVIRYLSSNTKQLCVPSLFSFYFCFHLLGLLWLWARMFILLAVVFGCSEMISFHLQRVHAFPNL